MQVNEYFKGIQGEGSTIGRPALFIRLSGCNMSCDFCDSKYANDEKGTTWDIDKLVSFIRDSSQKRVIFTGGEPMLQADEINSVIRRLPMHEFEIETNGTIQNTEMVGNIQFNISPKKGHINLDILTDYLRTEDSIFKFVIEDLDDILYWKKEIIDVIKIPSGRTYLMPEGTEKDGIIARNLWLAKDCLKYGYNLSPRLQIILWGNERGK